MVLAQKGHKVKLFEKETGWAACMAARLYPLGKAKYPLFLVWQRTQLEKLGRRDLPANGTDRRANRVRPPAYSHA